MKNLKIAIVSFEAIAGNLEENLRRTEEIARKATKEHADIIFFPETAITGYSSNNNIKPQEIEIHSATINKLCKISKANQMHLFP
ncbi:carbon-nitrogen hydrolase [Marinilabilia salmonicolor]|jgi:predicted amidohydrolase|uniref:nitrilase-related carbon-nitrogen hydrolase n=1 Tax=Marinilabilia salmonicolor TaxID=989 RepID=UPI000D07E33A|nr:nitrilase-related carbon-nitrogen hydrolase [Marinilabilia salmonicolor]PRY91359.1 carbon-nitrogen hydrolase [Marinilabilia salmonicolor]